jgi:ATP-dependent Lon protease
MILYNKTIAKKEMKKDKKYAKEDAKRIEKEIKQVKTGLEFLNFQTELHEKYGDEYTFNQREKDNMLEIYKAKYHLNNILDKLKHDLLFETRKINRDISYYIDENSKLTDWSRDYYKHYGVKKELNN